MLQKSSIWNTLSVFFRFPVRQHYLIEISRIVKIAHTSIKSNLDELVKLGLVKVTIEKRQKRKYPLYSANLDSNLFKQYKRTYNQLSLYESGLITYLDEKLTPKSIVLFGSFQKGDDTEDSDVDLFVECDKEDIDVKKFESKLARKIQLHFNASFTKLPKELKNNIINGIVVHGYLEGYK